MAENNEVLIRFKDRRFAEAFEKWLMDCAKRENIRMFFTKAGENEWDYLEDERALPADFWMPGKND
jgi:hypothetical protein